MLFVQGSSGQISLVKQLLDVIDQESGPEEVMTFPKPKFIPVYYSSAESVAEVLRQVYANRIYREGQGGRDSGRGGGFGGFGRFGGGGFGGSFGGRGGGNDRNRNGASQTEEPKMTLGVDASSNSIVVSAPGPLLKEVEGVVREIDSRAMSEPGEDVAVVALKRTNPELVRESLTSLFGDQARQGQSGSRSSSRGPTGPSSDFQRRMQMFEALRRGFGGGGGGGPDGLRSRGPGGPSGFQGRFGGRGGDSGGRGRGGGGGGPRGGRGG